MSVEGTVLIRGLRADDWPAVKAIYQQGIATGNATFETGAPSWETWDASHLAAHRLVGEAGGQVVGWAALSEVSNRCCYAGVAENSVYVAAAMRGRGVGHALLDRLLPTRGGTSRFPRNPLPWSAARTGATRLRIVGVRERLGQLNGAWRDVVLLERRSSTIG